MRTVDPARVWLPNNSMQLTALRATADAERCYSRIRHYPEIFLSTLLKNIGLWPRFLTAK